MFLNRCRSQACRNLLTTIADIPALEKSLPWRRIRESLAAFDRE